LPRLKAEYLNSLCSEILKRSGVSEVDAAIVSENLVEANLKGHDSHGVLLLPTYVARIGQGIYDVKAKIDILLDSPSITLLDGNWGFGQVIAKRAMEMAIAKAKRNGISYVGVRHSNHIGRLGYYAKMALQEDVIAIMMANSGGPVAPYGGKSPIMGTNPICVAIPSGTFPPLVLDMATSVVAGGKVFDRRERGEKVPGDWLIDHQGKPTTDPANYGPGKGTLLTLGGSVGYKGFGLSLVVDILGGILTGAGITVSKERRPGGNGISIICIDTKQITPVETFKQKTKELIEIVKRSDTRPGFEEVLVPGEPSSRKEIERFQNGIEIPESLWRKIEEIAEELGIDTKSTA